MKLHSDMTINGKKHYAGDELPAKVIYPFFLLHMGMFGLSGFAIAYGAEDISGVVFAYLHGGFAILVYLIFYWVIFGPDRVKWMFINAALGIFGISAQIGWILALFDKQVSDYAWYVHLVPFMYYVLYTFLLHQAVLDFSGARDNEERRIKVDRGYMIGSVVLYSAIALLS